MSALEIIEGDLKDKRKFDPSGCVCLMLQCSAPGKSKKIDLSDFDGIDADPELLSGSKKIFECKEYEEILTLFRTMKTKVKARSLPYGFVKSATYLIPPAYVQEVDDIVQLSLMALEPLVSAFMAVYQGDTENGIPALSAAMQGRLNSQWSEADYKPADKIRAQFNIQYEYVQFTLPGTLAEVSKKIYDREASKAEAKVQEDIRKIEMTLVMAAKETIEHIVEKLKPSQDGKKKRFHESSLENAREFFQLLKGRNITNCTELNEIADKGLALMSNVSIDDVKGSEAFRNSVVDTLEIVIKPVIDTMIENKPIRKITIQ